MKQLFVKSEGEWLPLIFEDLRWITKSKLKKNYISIHSDKNSFESKMSLSNVLFFLPENEFIRVHNSYIIRLDKITKIGSGFAHVKLEDKRIPVGESFVPELLNRCDFVK